MPLHIILKWKEVNVSFIKCIYPAIFDSIKNLANNLSIFAKYPKVTIKYADATFLLAGLIDKATRKAV